MNTNSSLKIGITLAFFAVVLGAFGAHGLEESLNVKQMETWKTAVHYHMWHALALILLSVTKKENSLSAWFFITGILLFSGSLYLLCLSGITKLGMITPFGGLCFLLGWGTWLKQGFSKKTSV